MAWDDELKSDFTVRAPDINLDTTVRTETGSVIDESGFTPVPETKKEDEVALAGKG